MWSERSEWIVRDTRQENREALTSIEVEAKWRQNRVKVRFTEKVFFFLVCVHFLFALVTETVTWLCQYQLLPAVCCCVLTFSFFVAVETAVAWAAVMPVTVAFLSLQVSVEAAGGHSGEASPVRSDVSRSSSVNHKNYNFLEFNWSINLCILH